MSEFDGAIKHILANEGGFVNDPADPGGATNYGLSLRYLRTQTDKDGDGFLIGDFDKDGDVDIDDIVNMDIEDAILVYRSQWWARYRYGDIRVQGVATKLFDLSVNMGPRQAHKCIQRALRSVGQAVADDGILGPKTMAAINNIVPEPLLSALRSEAAGIYRQIVAKRPQSSKFLNGWLNRAYS